MRIFKKDKFDTLKSELLRRVPFLALLIVSAIAASVLLSKTVNTIKIKHEDSTVIVHSVSSNVNRAMKAAGFGNKKYKIVNTKKEGRVTTVSVVDTFTVYVTLGDETKKITTAKSTVGGILNDMGIEIDEFDMVEPSVDTPINATSCIDFTNIDYVLEDVTEDIPSEITTVYSPELEEGVTNTIEGTNGVKLITRNLKLVNGKIVEENIINECVVAKATNTVKTIGIKKKSPSVLTLSNSTQHVYTSFLTKRGGVYRNPYTGLRETYYSQRVLPGGGLKIPGRHVNEEGFVCDGDGYICLASSDYSKGTLIETSRGMGKVYDCGCAHGTVDLYVNW